MYTLFSCNTILAKHRFDAKLMIVRQLIEEFRAFRFMEKKDEKNKSYIWYTLLNKTYIFVYGKFYGDLESKVVDVTRNRSHENRMRRKTRLTSVRSGFANAQKTANNSAKLIRSCGTFDLAVKRMLQADFGKILGGFYAQNFKIYWFYLGKI